MSLDQSITPKKISDNLVCPILLASASPFGTPSKRQEGGGVSFPGKLGVALVAVSGAFEGLLELVQKGLLRIDWS